MWAEASLPGQKTKKKKQACCWRQRREREGKLRSTRFGEEMKGSYDMSAFLRHMQKHTNMYLHEPWPHTAAAKHYRKAFVTLKTPQNTGPAAESAAMGSASERHALLRYDSTGVKIELIMSH